MSLQYCTFDMRDLIILMLMFAVTYAIGWTIGHKVPAEKKK